MRSRFAKVGIIFDYAAALEEELDGVPQRLIWRFNRGMSVAFGFTVLGAIPLLLLAILLVLLLASGDLRFGEPWPP